MWSQLLKHLSFCITASLFGRLTLTKILFIVSTTSEALDSFFTAISLVVPVLLSARATSLWGLGAT